MFSFIRKIYDWMATKVHSPYALIWLSTLFFCEAIFFFPVDPLLILFCIENKNKALFYATLATIFSVLGGITGYAIGAYAWNYIGMSLVGWMVSEQTWAHMIEKYRLYEHWTVLIAGFSPIPYKAITLSAGFCQLPLVPFIIYSSLARGARFFLIAGTMRIWGTKIKVFIDHYFNQLLLLFILLIIISIWLGL